MASRRAAADLDKLTAGSRRGTPEVLSALHAGDAIRLTTTGQVAVAYPFSGTPTRHRVRIANRIDVHAMCAVDALGISAMLGQETRIVSTDVITGTLITVSTTAGGTGWDPPDAVVFVGADARGGPRSTAVATTSTSSPTTTSPRSGASPTPRSRATSLPRPRRQISAWAVRSAPGPD